MSRTGPVIASFVTWPSSRLWLKWHTQPKPFTPSTLSHVATKATPRCHRHCTVLGAQSSQLGSNMINPHSVNEARMTLRRALRELQSQAVSEALQSPRSSQGRGAGAPQFHHPTQSEPLPGCSSPEASVLRLGSNKRLQKWDGFLYPGPFISCFSPTGVSRSRINQTSHNGKSVSVKTRLKFCFSEPSASCGYRTCCDF